MRALPVWLLDIDGVINAATKQPDRNVWPLVDWVAGRARDGGRSWPILAAKPVAEFIRQVHARGRAEIRWHTTWQQWARSLEELLDLPSFPVAEAPEWHLFLRAETEQWWKIGAALRVVEEERRPLLWTDDDASDVWSLPNAVRTRITSAQPTLIVAPSPQTGLCRRHLRQIDEFLTECALTAPAVEVSDGTP
ncbi:hypothetical protein [Phytohabitans houttuyneae]|uniref:FCP1 homology domain-containing protein n=1 Tax=Phytohabitans houttuyneae TaxID=1076126 RepID=A0A6V8KCF8_9ACTN|nr:hypothetical protein [Phytohabitans houttuyneae]GFJ79407.1 hypothetical protein Phou_035870 [Phytohabitans houttuyneae]